MGDDDNKFFDVSRSQQTGPHPTSKPIIVGHHPMMPDPMLREEDSSSTPMNIPVRRDKPTPEVPEPVEPDKLPSLHDISAPHETGPALTPSDSTAVSPELTDTVSQDPNASAIFMTESPPAAEDIISPQTSVRPAIQMPPTGPQPPPPTFQVPALSGLATPTGGRSPESTSASGGEELHLPAGHAAYHHKPRVWVWVLVALVILASIYAAVDAKTDWLPFHIFNHSSDNTTTPAADSSSSTPPTNQSTLPAGFTQYQPTGTPLVFAYPDTWGKPTTTTDPGFSQRGTGKKADGVHAYLIGFATNKDIQIAITSSKYLPAARGALYYDYLQWYTGTGDGKFYKCRLLFKTAGGVDTPSTTSCDQGPLTDATKFNNAIIIQSKTKDPFGAVLGDIYTANLSDAALPVLRVKDAKMQSGSDIKKLLGTITGAPGG